MGVPFFGDANIVPYAASEGDRRNPCLEGFSGLRGLRRVDPLDAPGLRRVLAERERG